MDAHNQSPKHAHVLCTYTCMNYVGSIHIQAHNHTYAYPTTITLIGIKQEIDQSNAIISVVARRALVPRHRPVHPPYVYQ